MLLASRLLCTLLVSSSLASTKLCGHHIIAKAANTRIPFFACLLTSSWQSRNILGLPFCRHNPHCSCCK